MRTMLFGSIVSFVLATGPAYGQAVVESADPYLRTPTPQRWYLGPGGGGYNGGGYGFSSTPIEGAARGIADVIRARGQAAESTSNALLTYEEARSRFYDNKLKWTEIYWARRRLNEAERDKDYAAMRTRRDAWRANRTQRFAALNPAQLDPSTGAIDWPTALQAPEYYSLTRKLDELFLVRVNGSIPGLDQEINRTTFAIKELLKGHMKNMTPHEYIDARKFVDGLNYEIHAPPAG